MSREKKRARKCSDEVSADHATIIPVVEEQVRVEKKEQESGRVVVQISPKTRTETVDVSLNEEQIEVERVRVDRLVDGPVPVRQEGDVTIVPVLEEVLVVEKRLRVKEEIRLIRKKARRRETQRVLLRSEEAQINRSQARDP